MLILFSCRISILSSLHSKGITNSDTIMLSTIHHTCREKTQSYLGLWINNCKIRALICTAKDGFGLAPWLKKAEQLHSGVVFNVCVWWWWGDGF